MTLNDLIKYYKDNNISKDAEISVRVGLPDMNNSNIVRLTMISLDECDIEYHDPALIIYTPFKYIQNISTKINKI